MNHRRNKVGQIRPGSPYTLAMLGIGLYLFAQLLWRGRASMPLPEALTWAAMLIAFAWVDCFRRPRKEWGAPFATLALYLIAAFDLARWQGQVPDWVHLAIVWMLLLVALALPRAFARYLGHELAEVPCRNETGRPDSSRAIDDERRE
ncbi:MAG TPA: hypothetical protein VEZ44_15095 [bacterium]|nr:hypothetical protein [bacterium]